MWPMSELCIQVQAAAENVFCFYSFSGQSANFFFNISIFALKPEHLQRLTVLKNDCCEKDNMWSCIESVSCLKMFRFGFYIADRNARDKSELVPSAATFWKQTLQWREASRSLLEIPHVKI